MGSKSHVAQFLLQTLICFLEIEKVPLESVSQKAENSVKLTNFSGLQ